MSKNKIKILFLGFVVMIGGLSFYQPAGAAGASVYVSPATLSKNVGESFNLSVGVSGGEKVCAVEGKLNLNKLSCQSVSAGDGVMAQSSPSCSNLYFLIGIPGCATSNKTLFTVNVKAVSAGIAAANFTGVDIIGEGMSVSSASVGGSYALTSVSVPTPPAEGKIQEKKVLPGKEVAPPEKEVIPPEEEIIPTEKKVVAVPPQEGQPSLFLASLEVIGESAWMKFALILSLAGLTAIGVKEWKLAGKKKKSRA